MPWLKTPMHQALEAARVAYAQGEVPVGAVIVTKTGEILAVCHNAMRTLNDPTAHAEVLAIRRACTLLKQERLAECDLYTTLEPCGMCAAAIGFARIRRLYFGAYDEKMGAVFSRFRFFEVASTHHPEIYDGIGAQESQMLMKKFFLECRERHQ